MAKIVIELDLPDFEAEPSKLTAVLPKLADTIDNDPEPDTNVMDGSLNVRDLEGNIVGCMEFDY